MVLAGISYLLYPIIQQRYFQSAENSIIIHPDTDNPDPEIIPPPSQNEIGTEAALTNGIEEATQQDNLKKNGEIFRQITSENCNNECTELFGAELEYCKEVCGLKVTQEASGDCAGSDGLEKDYCLKDLSIIKKDFTICKQIKDANIKLVCKNRIIEDNIDNALNQNSLPSE